MENSLRDLLDSTLDEINYSPYEREVYFRKIGYKI